MRIAVIGFCHLMRELPRKRRGTALAVRGPFQQEVATKHTIYYALSTETRLQQAACNLLQAKDIPYSAKEVIGYIDISNPRRVRVQSRYTEIAEEIESWVRRSSFAAAVWAESHLASLHPRLGYEESLTMDLYERDKLPQSLCPKEEWFSPRFTLHRYRVESWGPWPRCYPPPTIPQRYNPIEWQRDRIILIAKKYIGLPYQSQAPDGRSRRGHFPARGCGLDCSNFTSWVYNYGLGIRFASAVDEQLCPQREPNAGRVLYADREYLEPKDLAAGDLIFYDSPTHGKSPRHVVMYLGDGCVIDSASRRNAGVQVTDLRRSKYRHSAKSPFWKNPRYMHVRRPIEAP